MTTVPDPLRVVDSHTAGEPTRVVLGGLAALTAPTLQGKQDQLYARHPDLIASVVGEPRGSAPLHAVVPTEPDEAGADVALLIFSALGPLEMCGHALIGTVTTLLEEGLIALPDQGDASTAVHALTVQTLAGLIEVEAEVDRSEPRTRVVAVSFANAPSWVLADDLELDVPAVGRLRLALVYGGLWYAVVDARQLGLEIELDRVNELMLASRRVRTVVNDRLADLLGPDADLPDAPRYVPQLLWTTDGGDRDGTNLATSTQLGFDRSPCGTGSSARTALAHARGLLAVGEVFEHRSILGTTFVSRIESAGTRRDGREFVVPRVRGSAWLTARATLLHDPTDPFAVGVFVPPVDPR
jgi:proline racemase